MPSLALSASCLGTSHCTVIMERAEHVSEVLANVSRACMSIIIIIIIAHEGQLL